MKGNNDTSSDAWIGMKKRSRQMLHKLVDELVDNTPYMERMQRVYVSQSIVSTTVALLSLHTLHLHISVCLCFRCAVCAFAHSPVRVFYRSTALFYCPEACVLSSNTSRYSRVTLNSYESTTCWTSLYY